MSRPPFEVADIIRISGDSFRQRFSAALTRPQRKMLCFAACSLEVCLRPENGPFHPRRSSFRTIFLSDCVRLQRGLRTLAGPALPASAQPKGMKNPQPTSFPGRTSAFLQTALSDLLRSISIYRLIPRSSSDRVLTFFGNLPRAGPI
jgi:hypothetical protein